MTEPESEPVKRRESEGTTGQASTFLAAPSSSDLRPSQQESYLLRKLWNWKQRSAESQREWGRPLSP